MEPNKQKISLACLNDLTEKTLEFLRNKYNPINESEAMDPNAIAQNDETIQKDHDNPAPMNSHESVEFNINEPIVEHDSNIVNDNSINDDNDPIVDILQKSSVVIKEDKSCFTMIGQTQDTRNDNDTEETKTFSQFFSRPKEKETLSVPDQDSDIIDKSYQESINLLDNEGYDDASEVLNYHEENEYKAPRSRSPVLRADMFDEPELPGMDAVYINRYKFLYFKDNRFHSLLGFKLCFKNFPISL